MNRRVVALGLVTLLAVGVCSLAVSQSQESRKGEETLDSMKIQLGTSPEDAQLPPSMTARTYAAELMRKRMARLTNGRDFSNVSDGEMLDGIVYFQFPNFFVWGGYANLVYRFRPWVNEPEQALMEIIVLPPVPKDAPVPPPAPLHLARA